MLSAEEARWIIAFLDPGRLAWRAASDDESAAVGLDLGTGELAVLGWAVREGPPAAEGVLVLAFCPAHRRVDSERALSEGCEVPPSADVMEEHVVRADARGGVYWPLVEALLASGGRAA